jgi:hypothetical protein
MYYSHVTAMWDIILEQFNRALPLMKREMLALAEHLSSLPDLEEYRINKIKINNLTQNFWNILKKEKNRFFISK